MAGSGATGLLRIGIDFDNTILGYDDVFLEAARDQGLIAASFVGSKQLVRDAVRLLPDGEMRWQALQGHAYGVGIKDALLMPGVDRFLGRCRAHGAAVSIVSHKTEFGHFDIGQTNLRQSAMAWLTAQGFFDRAGFGLAREDVYFEDTRAAKIARIAALKCSHFIDDLEEVLTDPAFPQDVVPVLYDASRSGGQRLVGRDWREIEDMIFAEAATRGREVEGR